MVKLLCISFSALVFCSCLEVQQYVTSSGLGTNTRFHIALQKSLFELADSDIDEIFPIGFSEEDFEYALKDTQMRHFEVVDNEFERTLVFEISSPWADMADRIDSILPIKTPSGYILPILPLSGNNTIDSLDNAMAAAILSSAKYRIILDKSLGTLTKAVLHSEEKTIEFPLSDFQSVYIVEISMMYLFVLPSGMYLELR
ncbi:MAG: hypothetical protein ACRC5H_01925 [Treponemataceae bacterium]